MNYEALDAAEVYLVALLRKAKQLKAKGIHDHGVDHVQVAIEAVRKERKCRRGHSASGA